MKLKNINSLRGRDALVRQQLIERALETEESGRVRAQAEIHANGTDGGLVTNPQSDPLHHVIEVPKILLPEPEAYITHSRIDVPHVVKKYAAEVGADQGKAQRRRMHHQRISTDRKPRF